MVMEFIRCDVCADTPQASLCNGCANNQALINRLAHAVSLCSEIIGEMIELAVNEPEVSQYTNELFDAMTACSEAGFVVHVNYDPPPKSRKRPGKKLLAWFCQHDGDWCSVSYFREGDCPEGTMWMRAPWLDEPEDNGVVEIPYG